MTRKRPRGPVKLTTMTEHAIKYSDVASPLARACEDARDILQAWAGAVGVKIDGSNTWALLGELVAWNILSERGYDQDAVLACLGLKEHPIGHAMGDLLAELERKRKERGA